MSHPVIAVDIKGKILFANNAAVQLFHTLHGKPLVIGNTLFNEEVYPPEAIESMKTLLNQTISGESPEKEWDFILNGVRHYYKSAYFPLRDEQGTIYGAVSHAEPVTSYKLTQIRLQDSEELYEMAVHGNSAGLWDWKKIPGDEQWWSPRLYELIGYSPEEMPSTRQSFYALLHPDEADYVRNEVWLHLREKKKLSLEIRLKTAHDGYRWFESRGQASWDENGEPLRMVGSLVDITERVRSLKLLKTSESKFRAIFNQSIQLMVVFSVNGEVLEVNDTALRALNPDIQPTLGLHVSQSETFRRSPDLHDHLLPLIRQAAQGKAARTEMTFYTKTMLPVRIDVSLKPVIPESGEIELIIAEARDMSEIYNARDAQEKNRLLEIHNRQLQEFAHITSHNLRSPAGNLHVLINLFNQADTPDEKVFIHNKLKESTEHLLKSLDILTEVVRVKSGAMTTKTLIRFDETFSKVKSALMGLIMESGTTLETDFQVEEIFFPEVYLESIFQNLLSNAIKYRDISRTNLVQISTFTEFGRSVLLFRDNGSGIDLSRYRKKIFGLYNTFHGNPDAQGAGLFMVKNQIEAMGGSITVDSTPGKGTMFRVVF